MHLIVGPFSVMTLLAPHIPWLRTRPFLCSSYSWENKSHSTLFPHKPNFPVQMLHGISPGGELLEEPANLHCRDLDPGLKPYENIHTSSAVEDSVMHSIIKQGRKEGHRLGWTNLSMAELRVSLHLCVSDLPSYSWYRNFFTVFLYTVKSHWHCLLPVLVNHLLPVLSHFSRLQSTTKCWHQMS